MTPKELIKHLETFEDQDALIAYDIWQIEDVQTQAPHLTEEQCADVINEMEHRKDACIGLSWDVMDVYIWRVEEENKQNANAL